MASSDPLENSVILWTRVAPKADNDGSNVTVTGMVPLFDHDNEKYVQKSDKKVCVEWEISETEDFKTYVDRGTVYTSSDVDYTVKVRRYVREGMFGLYVVVGWRGLGLSLIFFLNKGGGEGPTTIYCLL